MSLMTKTYTSQLTSPVCNLKNAKQQYTNCYYYILDISSLKTDWILLCHCQNQVIILC